MKLIVISSEDLVFSVTLPTKYLLLFFPANSTKTKSPDFGLQVSIKSSSSTSSELQLSSFSDFFPNSFLSYFDAIFCPCGQFFIFLQLNLTSNWGISQTSATTSFAASVAFSSSYNSFRVITLILKFLIMGSSLPYSTGINSPSRS